MVEYVAIDLCPTFRAALRRALPDAVIVVGAFHVVQLANGKLAQLRRRITWAQRGRKGDPEWEIRGLLMRNTEDLSAEQLAKIGFRNRHDQRLRSRCATTRRARRQGLPPLAVVRQ